MLHVSGVDPGLFSGRGAGHPGGGAPHRNDHKGDTNMESTEEYMVSGGGTHPCTRPPRTVLVFVKYIKALQHPDRTFLKSIVIITLLCNILPFSLEVMCP